MKYKRIVRPTLLAAICLLCLPAPAVLARGDPDDATLRLIKSRATAEIDRRLSGLGRLNRVIDEDARLQPDMAVSLVAQVTTEINSLADMRQKIGADSDLATARIDVQPILSEYREYALIVPKVRILRTANDQLLIEEKFNTVSGKLQTRINQAAAAGKNTGGLQTALNNMITHTQTAQKLSAAAAQAVLPLQPTDYNNDHTILSGLRDQLKTAHQENLAALSDTKTAVQELTRL